MYSRFFHGFFEGHSTIDNVDDSLDYRCWDAGTAGCANGKEVGSIGVGDVDWGDGAQGAGTGILMVNY